MIDLANLITKEDRERKEHEHKCIVARRNRDALLKEAAWRRDRHLDELALGIDTTLSEREYIELLSYIQSLRDYPNKIDSWWEAELPTNKFYQMSIK